jgi:hypothetical protein
MSSLGFIEDIRLMTVLPGCYSGLLIDKNLSPLRIEFPFRFLDRTMVGLIFTVRSLFQLSKVGQVGTIYVIGIKFVPILLNIATCGT